MHSNLVLVLLIVPTAATWIVGKFFFLCCILVTQDFETSSNLHLHQKSAEVNKYPSFFLLSQSSLESLISLDLVDTKLYCFWGLGSIVTIVCMSFSTNPVRRSEKLRGGSLF